MTDLSEPHDSCSRCSIRVLQELQSVFLEIDLLHRRVMAQTVGKRVGAFAFAEMTDEWIAC